MITRVCDKIRLSGMVGDINNVKTLSLSISTQCGSILV